MRFNGDENLKNAFGSAVEELFSDNRFSAAEVWFIDSIDTMNLFYSTFSSMELSVSETINSVIIVTTMNYEDFSEQAKQGLTYVLKVNSEEQVDPVSRDNLMVGWKALYTPVVGEIMNGSENDKNLEILINQAIFSILDDVNMFLLNIPQVKNSVVSFIGSKKTELGQKVSDLNEAISQSEILGLNEDVSALMEEKNNAISELTAVIETYKNTETELMESNKNLESEKEQLNYDLESKLQEIENLNSQIEELRNAGDYSEEVENLKNLIIEKDALIEDITSKVKEQEEAINSLGSEFTASKEKLKKLESELDANGDIDNLRNDLENKQNQLVNLTSALEEKDEEISQRDNTIREFEEEVEKQHNLLAESQSTIKEQEEKIKELMSKGDNSEAISELETSLEELKKQKDALEEEKTSLENEKASLVEQLKSAVDNSEFEEKLSILTKEKVELEEKIKELQTNSDSLTAEKSELEEKLDHAVKALGNKDELLSKVEGDKNTTELLDKIETQTSKLAEYKAIISEMREQHTPKKNGLQINTVKTLFGKDIDSESLKTELNKLKNELAEKDLKIQELMNGSDVNTELAKENTELKDKLREAEERLAELSSKISETEL